MGISERRGLADATALRSPVQLVHPSATTSIYMSQPRSSIRHVRGWCEESQAIHAF